MACQPVLVFAEETESVSEEADLRGPWDGTDTESNGNDLVKRDIALDCDKETGDFEGIAQIDNGENGEYYKGILHIKAVRLMPRSCLIMKLIRHL